MQYQPAGVHELWVMSKADEPLDGAPFSIEVTADTADAEQSQVRHLVFGINVCINTFSQNENMFQTEHSM